MGGVFDFMSVDLRASDCLGSSVRFQNEFDMIDDPKCQSKHSPGGKKTCLSGRAQRNLHKLFMWTVFVPSFLFVLVGWL